MRAIDNALDLSKAQVKAAGQAAQAINACVNAMLEASAAFAKTNAEHNIEMATTMMSARSIESVTEIHGAFVRDSMRAAGVMATKIADACGVVAKRCNEVASETPQRTMAPDAAKSVEE